MLFKVLLSNTAILVEEISQEEFDYIRSKEGYSNEDPIIDNTLYCVKFSYNEYKYGCIIKTTSAPAAYTKAFAHACDIN